VGPDRGAATVRIEVHPRPVRPGGPPLWAEAASPDDAVRLAHLELGALVGDTASARAHREATRGLALPVAILAPSPDMAGELASSLPGAVALVRVPID
jgi:hypothetical protein